MTPFSLRKLRFTRAAATRSRSATMTPRCFFSIAGRRPRRIGCESFSNVKEGIVCLLVVELKHSRHSPRYRSMDCLDGKPFHAVYADAAIIARLLANGAI